MVVAAAAAAAPSFEIKVALLGYVSAGKSTVLNALLQGKFSQVAMRRTTAGVNKFRIHHDHAGSRVQRNNTSTQAAAAAGQAANNGSVTDTTSTLRSAEFTLNQITHDNAILRQTNQVLESTFDIELDDPLCSMRKDTKLVLIDIPGLNEAGSNDLYRTYINEHWDTFDCVIAVMDVFQGVNTDEQVQLLELIRDNNSSKKCVPFIVLCNKMDDPDDDEVQMLVTEVRLKVHEIFQMDGPAPKVARTNCSTAAASCARAGSVTPGVCFLLLIECTIALLDLTMPLILALCCAMGSVYSHFGRQCLCVSHGVSIVVRRFPKVGQGTH
jgi:small GTP-binding protein